MNDYCDTCRFWFPLDRGPTHVIGACRRRAPVALPAVNSTPSVSNLLPPRTWVTVFPETARSFSCGEHERMCGSVSAPVPRIMDVP